MEPKPGSSEASKDPGVLTTHHSYTDQDFEGESLHVHRSVLTLVQVIGSMPCTSASTFPAATDAVDTTTADIEATDLLLPHGSEKKAKTTMTDPVRM